MAGSATPERASAVCIMGGLGSLGCARIAVQDLRAAAATMRAATNRAFNLNFFIQNAPKTDPAAHKRTRERLRPWYAALGLGEPPRELPDLAPAFDAQRLSLLLALRPAVVSFHFGTPGTAAIAALKVAGIALISSATTVAEAQTLQACVWMPSSRRGGRLAGTGGRTNRLIPMTALVRLRWSAKLWMRSEFR